jgi:hypothetical protein
MSEEVKEEKFSEVIDMTDEEFKQFCSTKNRGYIQSLQNLFEAKFFLVSKMREDLVNLSLKEKDSDKKAEMEQSVKELYVVLFRLENKVELCKTNMKKGI